MKSIIRLWVLLFLVGIPVTAQDFEVAPVKVLFSVDPGESDNRVLTVTNHSSRTTSFVVGLGDFLDLPTGERSYLPPGATEYSCSEWLSLNPGFFTLNPNESTEINLGILVPSGEFGTRWSMVFIQTTREQTSLSADREVQAGVLVSSQIGIQVVQSPSSNKNYSGRIFGLKDISPEPGSFSLFEARVENDGEKVLNCKVYLVVTNIQTAEEYSLSPQSFDVFPGSVKTIMLRREGILSPGRYAVAAILDYGSQSSLKGSQTVIEVK